VLIRGSERLRLVASVILTIAGLVILDESIPHPGPFAQAPLLIDTILLGVVAVLTCVCWPRTAVANIQNQSRFHTLSTALIAVAGAILLAYTAHRLLPVMFAGRINVYQGDMLVVIDAAVDRFLHGKNPYTLYYVPWEVPLPYGPWLWMPYVLPHVMAVDPRVLTLVAFLTVVATILWSSAVSIRLGDPMSSVALLVLATVLALHTRIGQFYGIGHTLVYWPLLFAFCCVLRTDRATAVALMTGCLVPARTTMVSFIPIVLMHLYYQGQLTARRVLLMTAAAVLPFLPFALIDWRSFKYDVFGSYVAVVKQFVWRSTDWAHQTLGVTGVLLRHGWDTYAEAAQSVILLFVYALAWRAIRRGARPEPWLALALLTFSMTALWPLIYLYFDVFVFLASALAAHALVSPSQRSMRLVGFLAGCATVAVASVIAVATINPGAAYIVDVGTPSASGLTGAGFGRDVAVIEGGRTFVWIEGDVARVRLPRAGWLGTTIHIVIKPFAPAGAPRQRVRALLNDHTLGVADLESNWSDVGFDAPRHVWFYGFNLLELRFDHAVSPAQFGYSGDTRLLSAAVDTISVGR